MTTSHMTAGKTIKIRQTGSPIRRKHDQLATLLGLGLGRVGSVAEIEDTKSIQGMIAKVAHLVSVVDER